MNTFALFDLSTPDLIIFISLIVAVVIVVALVKLGRKVRKNFIQGYTGKEE